MAVILLTIKVTNIPLILNVKVFNYNNAILINNKKNGEHDKKANKQNGIGSYILLIYNASRKIYKYTARVTYLPIPIIHYTKSSYMKFDSLNPTLRWLLLLHIMHKLKHTQAKKLLNNLSKRKWYMIVDVRVEYYYY